ncbi:MAG TPA: hypothetical protein VMX17_01480 [Candidatus Glassbacteria bacterium]|nr:hypothetical protein [Candidatus Glassbacteria bacterium]
MINIAVEIGDTILTGKFKNKAVEVKTIGTDDHGMPTINGKKVVTFRIKKDIGENKMAKKKKKLDEGMVMISSLLPVGGLIGMPPKRVDNFEFKGLPGQFDKDGNKVLDEMGNKIEVEEAYPKLSSGGRSGGAKPPKINKGGGSGVKKTSKIIKEEALNQDAGKITTLSYLAGSLVSQISQLSDDKNIARIADKAYNVISDLSQVLTKVADNEGTYDNIKAEKARQLAIKLVKKGI